jgi:hypothetical protein
MDVKDVKDEGKDAWFPSSSTFQKPYLQILLWRDIGLQLACQ